MLTHIFCSLTTNCSFLAYFSFLPRMTFLQIEEVYLFPDLELTFLSRFFYQVSGAQKSEFLLESHSWLFSSAALINLGYWDNLWVLSQCPRSASCSYSEVQFAQNLSEGVCDTSLLPAAAPSFLPRKWTVFLFGQKNASRNPFMFPPTKASHS